MDKINKFVFGDKTIEDLLLEARERGAKEMSTVKRKGQRNIVPRCDRNLIFFIGSDDSEEDTITDFVIAELRRIKLGRKRYEQKNSHKLYFNNVNPGGDGDGSFYHTAYRIAYLRGFEEVMKSYGIKCQVYAKKMS